MGLKFQLGQKVVVNTGGRDEIAFIDYPTNHKPGRVFDFVLEEPEGTVNYLCRFTDDYRKTLHAGAVSVKDYSKFLRDGGRKPRMAVTSAQFVEESSIRPFVFAFEDIE